MGLSRVTLEQGENPGVRGSARDSEKKTNFKSRSSLDIDVCFELKLFRTLFSTLAGENIKNTKLYLSRKYSTTSFSTTSFTVYNSRMIIQ